MHALGSHLFHSYHTLYITAFKYILMQTRLHCLVLNAATDFKESYQSLIYSLLFIYFVAPRIKQREV